MSLTRFKIQLDNGQQIEPISFYFDREAIAFNGLARAELEIRLEDYFHLQEYNGFSHHRRRFFLRRVNTDPQTGAEITERLI